MVVLATPTVEAPTTNNPLVNATSKVYVPATVAGKAAKVVVA